VAGMQHFLLIIAVVALMGCGKKEPVQPSASNTEATKPEKERGKEATQPTIPNTEAAKPEQPSESAVLNAWFEALDRENFPLHDTLLEALFVSRRTGKTVFVLRVAVEGAKTPPHLYRVSLERGGADNIVGVNHATREFLFDHFLPSDGPTLQQTRQRLHYDGRVRELKKDLGIFGIK